MTFDNGWRLAEHLRNGRGLLIDFDGDLDDIGRRVDRRVSYLAIGARERMGLSALLIRPDGIIAWPEETATGTDLERAIDHWFGAPDDDVQPGTAHGRWHDNDG